MPIAMKVIQALLFTLSLVFIVIFVYIFIANSSVMLGHQKSLTSVWQSLNLPSIDHQDTSFSSSHRSMPSPHLPANGNNVVVNTKYGKYIGVKQSILGTEVSAFLGIPYALPPIGGQRFRKSIPIVPSKKTVNATKFSDKCVQLKKDVPIFTDVSSGMSEDCLRLNVWTPVPLTLDDPIRSHQIPRSLNLTGSTLKPVMVWIYGGGFFMGTSAFDETDGRVLASYGDVIVVTFDYRVGPLGFIDLETDREPGNQGLYDQMTALKWVKDNIKHFGGDPNSITLFGESSGAISISLHMMSPISSKYFTRAILQSGSAFMTDAFYRRGESSVPEFVKLLSCLKNNYTPKDKLTTPSSASKISTSTNKSTKKDESSDYDYDYNEGSSSESDAVVKDAPSNKRPKRQIDDAEGDDEEGGGDSGNSGGTNGKVTFDEDTEESSTGTAAEYDIECLRGKSVDEIIRVTKRLHEKYFFAFPPSPEEEFIPLIPSAVAKLDADEKKDIFINMKDVLLGTNENGFSYMLYLANKNIFTRYNVTKDINNIASVRSVMENDLHHLLQMPRFQVDFLVNRQFSSISNSSNSSIYLNKLITLLGDMSFVCPVNELAYELASIGKNVYMYQFNHRSPDSPWGSWFGSTLHDEIPLVFGQPLRYPLKYSGKDIDISKRIMKTWSHFARTGQALPQLGIEWPKYTTTNQTYMKINSDYSQIDYKLSDKSCQSFKLGFDLLS